MISAVSGAPARDSSPPPTKADSLSNREWGKLYEMVTPPRLRDYEWVQEMVVTLRGKDKIRRRERCYFGEDSKIPEHVPVVPDAAEEKRRRAIEFTKADADTMQAARSMLGRYMMSMATVMDSLFKADPSVRRATTGTFKLKDRPYPGQEFVIEVGMQGGWSIYEGEGAARHVILATNTRYARVDDSTLAPITQAIEVPRYGFRMIFEMSGLKKRS